MRAKILGGFLLGILILSTNSALADRQFHPGQGSPVVPTEPGQGNQLGNQFADQTCTQSTYCGRGYTIWCSETGNTCWSDVGQGKWVWCAGYDEWGNSWESSDYCY